MAVLFRYRRSRGFVHGAASLSALTGLLLATACAGSGAAGEGSAATGGRPAGGAGGAGMERPASATDAGTPVLGSEDPFFQLLALTRATPVPRTLPEMVEFSAVIGRGHFASVSVGRTLDYATGASNPIMTAVFAIAVDDVIKGDMGSVAYAEFIRGGIPIERIREVLPKSLSFVFMLEEPGWDLNVYAVVDDGEGVPAGERLLAFMYPAGVVVEGPESLEYPFADVPTEKIFESASLEDLAGELRALDAARP